MIGIHSSNRTRKPNPSINLSPRVRWTFASGIISQLESASKPAVHRSWSFLQTGGSFRLGLLEKEGCCLRQVSGIPTIQPLPKSLARENELDQQCLQRRTQRPMLSPRPSLSAPAQICRSPKRGLLPVGATPLEEHLYHCHPCWPSNPQEPRRRPPQIQPTTKTTMPK